MRSFLAVFLLVRYVSSDVPLLNDFPKYQSGAYGVSPNQTYHSSNITSPQFNYNTWNPDLLAKDYYDSAHILLTLNYAGAGAGPYIFRDDDLSLVYADTSFGTTMNARVQIVDGAKCLTFWHGDKRGGHGKGHCVFYSDRYELKYNLTIKPPLTVDVDMHECQVTASGTVLLTAYQDKPANLSSLGFVGDDVLADSCFQEVDLVTNEAVFTWCASEWFSHDLSFQNFTKRDERQYDDDGLNDGGHVSPAIGVDAYHINSLQKVRGMWCSFRAASKRLTL